MAHQSSQYDYLFLLNAPIPIAIEGNEVLYVKTPSFLEYYSNSAHSRLEALFLTNLGVIESDVEGIGFQASTYLDIFIGFKIRERMLGTDSREARLEIEIVNLLEEITGVLVSESGVQFNGVELTEQDLLEIRAAYLTSTRRIDIQGNALDKNKQEEEESEFFKRMREMEEKVNKVKKSSLLGEEGTPITPSDQIKIIVYGLGMSISEVRALNMYGLAEFYFIAAEAMTDRVTQIAAGNGLLPEGSNYKPILPKS